MVPPLAVAITTYPVFLVAFRGRDYIPNPIEVRGEESAVEPSSVLADKWVPFSASPFDHNTWGVGRYQHN